MICDGLRDLARDVERNEKYKNIDHMGAEAATVHSSACNAEITKSGFQSPSKTFFSQEKIFECATRKHASDHSRARERDREISRDAREKGMECVCSQSCE